MVRKTYLLTNYDLGGVRYASRGALCPSLLIHAVYYKNLAERAFNTNFTNRAFVFEILSSPTLYFLNSPANK